MTYTVTKPLYEFEFWAGAKDRVKYLTMQELTTIEDILEAWFDTMTETEINDFFWFEEDTIAEWLGYESFDELMEREKEEEPWELCVSTCSSAA